MNKTFTICILLIQYYTVNAQTVISGQLKKNTLKMLEKKNIISDTLNNRVDTVKIVNEEAKPNPMKSKKNKTGLNPQPFPPTEKRNPKKG